MATRKTTDFAGAVNIAAALAGNVVSTHVVDRGDNRGAALLKITSAIGATPTVTVDIQGSTDGVDWRNIPYAVQATPETPTVAALVITTAVTNYYTLRPDHPWRFLRTNHTANTNVTLTIDYYS